MWYDDKDQLRLSQDARQVLEKDYAYTKYDELGRTEETGRLERFGGQIDQNLLNGQNFPDRNQLTVADVVTTIYDADDSLNTYFGGENLRTRVVATIRENAEGAARS